MNNPYKTIIDNGSVPDALLAAARASEDELCELAKRLTDTEVDRFEHRTIHTLRAVQVECTLCFGGVLYLYQTATKQEGRTTLFYNMIEDFGISDTKAYASMSVFRSFGKPLLEEPELMQRFPVESLKMLATRKASPAARDAAIELARKGERVSIKQAEALLWEHAPVEQQDIDVPVSEKCGSTKARRSCKQKRSKPQAKQIWSYHGDAVRLIIEADKPQAVANALVIHDLEAALQQFRRECEQADADSDQPDAALEEGRCLTN